MEEQSAKHALHPLLSGLADEAGATVALHAFRGKPDLLKKLPQRLSGYAATRKRGDDPRVAVLVDQDDDCGELKRRLDDHARAAGLVPRRDAAAGRPFNVLNRVAIRELEAWCFGDWEAVRLGSPKVAQQPPRTYRTNPDAAVGKCSDAFERVLAAGGIRVAAKPLWAERVGPHLDGARNSSTSFQAFVTGVAHVIKS
ncbi:DUF4276 family protein [Streptomyces spiramenti]|uniref:DUF4276 family protein n=1 Tax=Streptomyces spiramenti TaxID=2720606 RepID=A0ABX1ANG0_9ACTN|nr:DUF4276 family protein [Streptomyces spiramenti]